MSLAPQCSVEVEMVGLIVHWDWWSTATDRSPVLIYSYLVYSCVFYLAYVQDWPVSIKIPHQQRIVNFMDEVELLWTESLYHQKPRRLWVCYCWWSLAGEWLSSGSWHAIYVIEVAKCIIEVRIFIHNTEVILQLAFWLIIGYSSSIVFGFAFYSLYVLFWFYDS